MAGAAILIALVIVMMVVFVVVLNNAERRIPVQYSKTVSYTHLTITLNKKEQRAALKSALTSRVQAGKFIVVDELKFDEIKTKNFKNVMNNLNVSKALVVLADNDQNTVLSARNIADVKTAQVLSLIHI